LTNAHVVEGADGVEVALSDGQIVAGSIVGIDPITDLAAVQIEPGQWATPPLGRSAEVQPGQWAIAIGNPLGLDNTITAGIVSAIGRSSSQVGVPDKRVTFIQTDAAINPGNSGGALVNTNGQLIGINTAIASQTGSYTGYGFAVPVNLVKKVMDDLLKYGKVQRAVLGVAIQEITQDLADKEGLKALDGVMVQDVTANGSAEKAGVKKGDVILKVNDVTVNSVSSLQEEIGKYRPGDKVKLSVNRKGESKDITVTLKGLDGKESTSMADKTEINTIKGASFETISKEEKDKLGIKNGVKVVSVGEGPFKGKLQPGFIITKIDKQTVYTVQNVRSILESAEGAILIEGKNTDGTDNVIGLKIDK